MSAMQKANVSVGLSGKYGNPQGYRLLFAG